MQYELLDCEQLAARLNVRPSWVREMTRNRTQNPIPHLKLGKYRRFEYGSPQLTAWLDGLRVGGEAKGRR
jgi:hypothetical protein